ncbi:MAG TPA: hypothetical protein VF794_14155 [Archangium sp.]|uniref:hypothetical protein n=1 Tax=Archangium sp. TaxID=1872627 RepID=UPI002EDAFD39
MVTLGALVVLCTGCSGVRLRPDGTPEPQDCPRQTLEAMARMGLYPGDSFPVVMDERLGVASKARLEEGSVVGYVDRPYEQLPEGTRLFGQVWTAGEMVIIRYDAIQVPAGHRMPLCAEVDDSGGQEKDPASPKGVAIIQDNVGVVKVVTRYGEHDFSKDRGRVYIYRTIEDLPPKVRKKLKP